MKKFFAFIFTALLCGAIFTSCNNKPANNAEPALSPPLGGSGTATAMPDSTLDYFVFRIFQNTHGRFVVPYSAIVNVDTSTSPPTLTTMAQSGSYTTLNTILFKYTSGGTQMSSNASTISANTVRAIDYKGPFDIINGHITTYGGNLHYITSTGHDSTIAPTSRVIWTNQTGNGSGICVGITGQADVQ